jgi:hypothetical protein
MGYPTYVIVKHILDLILKRVIINKQTIGLFIRRTNGTYREAGGI